MTSRIALELRGGRRDAMSKHHRQNSANRVVSG